MRNNANKGEKTRKSNAKKRFSKAKKRENFKGEKNAKFKCEITRIKAKKRESQMRNNANKGEKTQKSNAK